LIRTQPSVFFQLIGINLLHSVLTSANMPFWTWQQLCLHKSGLSATLDNNYRRTIRPTLKTNCSSCGTHDTADPSANPNANLSPPSPKRTENSVSHIKI